MSKEVLNIIFFGFLFLAFGVLARQFVIGRGASLPVHVFMILVGAFIGIAAAVSNFDVDPLHLKDVSPETPFNIYTCILMFDCAFNTQVHYLRVIGYHMGVVVVPMIVMMYSAISLVGAYLLPYDDISIGVYIALVSVIMMPGPHMMKAYLAPTNVQHDLKTLLEGEAMFGNYIVYLGFNIAMTYENVARSILYACQDIFIGLTVGFLIGKLTIYWISTIFKDYVNQTTIVLAFCYGGFALSYLLGSNGYLCVVTMGLVISHRRSSMSTQFVQIFNCLMELIVFCLTSMACLSAGIYLVTMVIPQMSFIDLVVAMFIFVLQNCFRAFVLFMAYRFKAKHLQTKTNTMTIWACNIRGSYSLMMAFCLHGSGFRAEKVTKPIILVLLQIIISFIVNSMVCSYVIGYLNEDALSKKKWMIERAARLLIAIRKSTVMSLRNVASIADADWNEVNKQIRLKSDFMTAYRYAGWLSKQMEGRRDQSMDPDIDMKYEAIRQISLSEKASYSKIYSVGILSRESVINLMHLVTQSIKMKRLLLPSDVFKEEEEESFLNSLESELLTMISGGSHHDCVRILILVICFVDIVAIILAFFFITFDHKVTLKIQLITLQNIMMFLGYLSLVIFVIIKNRSFKSRSLWHKLYKFVVVISFFDLIVTAFPVLNQKTLNELVGRVGRKNFQKVFLITNITFVLTRLIRSLIVFQVLPIFQYYLLHFVIHRQAKKIFIECDMATGYMRVNTETLRKINGIAINRALVAELKYFCHKNKLETSQYLSLAQLKHPNVMAALKTKTALRLVLNSIERALIEMRDSGLLGEMDAHIVHKDLTLKMMATQNFPYFISVSSSKTFLQNIPWIEGDGDLLHEIETRGTVIKFYANDIIVTQGHLPGGIFIILNGIVRAESLRRINDLIPFDTEKLLYYCNDRVRPSRSNSSSGQLILHGFYTRGSIIGEIAFLNEKPEHKTYRCATYVEAFFVSFSDMFDITKRSPDVGDPLSPIEKRIWRTIAIRQAVRMIHNGTLSSNATRLAIFTRMMDSYIVDGNTTRTLLLTPNEMLAVILIQGYVSQFYSELRYVGPCILPTNQQKFLSHPELGPRIIYLIIKNKSVEDSALENLIPEEPQMSDYEDSLTISSGTSDMDPYRRERDDIELSDETDFPLRALASGLHEHDIKKVANYKVRSAYSAPL